MPESTNQPGPNQTPIRVDSRGRRRRADGDVAKFPDNADDPSKTTAVENAALRAELAAYKAQNDARTITGGGFSGTLGSGLSWNPFGANALGPASQDPAGGTPPTPTTAYIMGTNSTATGFDPANDSWTLASGPSPAGGGPYDGVTIPAEPRIVVDGSTVGRTVNDTVGTPFTLTVNATYTYSRPKTYSQGILVAIGEEVVQVSPLTGPNGSITSIS